MSRGVWGLGFVGFLTIRGTILGLPVFKDRSILVSLLGSPILGNQHLQTLQGSKCHELLNRPERKNKTTTESLQASQQPEGDNNNCKQKTATALMQTLPCRAVGREAGLRVRASFSTHMIS